MCLLMERALTLVLMEEPGQEILSFHRTHFLLRFATIFAHMGLVRAITGLTFSTT